MSIKNGFLLRKMPIANSVCFGNTVKGQNHMTYLFCYYLKRQRMLWKTRKVPWLIVCKQNAHGGAGEADRLLLCSLLFLSFRSLWKHFRAVSLCLFLLIFPAYMAYMICQFFHMDFWLLIIISSSILTSLQVTHRVNTYSTYKKKIKCFIHCA